MSILNALVLHRITDEKVANFEDILTEDFSFILKRIGSSFRLLGEQSETNACARSWLLTFDDGNASDYDIALPLLQKYNVKATFFIVTSWVGKPGYLNWEQIKYLDLAGMQIGSHSINHKNMTKILKPERIHELVSSRILIEDHIGKTAKAFSFPLGICNATTIKEVFESGYELCCTSQHGIFSPGKRTIPRNSINGSMSKNKIYKAMNASHSIRAQWFLEEALKSILKSTLKLETYKTIRALFTR